MRIKQTKPSQVKARRKNRIYSPSSLTNAYLAVQNGMSVRGAVRQFDVPRSTLRDRVVGKVDTDCVTTGRAPVLSLEEEARLVEHIKVMASYGYGYTRQEVVDIATDYCIQLNLRNQDESLTLKWFRGFIKRWPELKVLKPRSLEIQRAKCATAGSIEKYFRELRAVVVKYDLADKPHLIFNVDEKGVTSDHKPPSVIGSAGAQPPAVTSGRSQTITILGCGSASGISIPPYFIFPGKRMNAELMNVASPGSDCSLSESGWSNSIIFQNWLKEHFVKFAPGRQDDYILLLLDGHKSHIAVDLIEWAQAHKIILHILPAHTSHILQPLDVGCYGPFQRIYDYECHKKMRANASVITKFNVAEIACKVYQLALFPQNLQSSFKRTGIFPLDENVIPREAVIPAEVFQSQLSQQDEHAERQSQHETNQEEMSVQEVVDPEHDMQQDGNIEMFFVERVENLKRVKSDTLEKKERNTIGKIVSGRAITEEAVAERVKTHIANQKPSKPRVKPVKQNVQGTKKSTGKSQPKCKKHSKSQHVSQKPGPSHIYIDEDSELDDLYTSDDSTQVETEERERCCVCKKFTPDKMRQSMVVEFTSWVQCSNQTCSHWVHLKYCSPLKAVRRGTVFFCIHCEDLEQDKQI